MRIGNTNNAISSLLLLYNPLQAKVTRIQTCKKFLDAVNFTGGTNATADPTAKFEDQIYYIDRVATENPQLVEFELASKLDRVNVALPRRQVMEYCPWVYREESTCGYKGTKYFDINNNPTTEANDVCGKRYTSCTLRFPEGDLPFGGFQVHDFRSDAERARCTLLPTRGVWSCYQRTVLAMPQHCRRARASFRY